MRLRLPGRPRRALLRTRVMVGVLLVTLVALAAFDVAGITALRSYLLGQTDSQLLQVVRLDRTLNQVSQPGLARAAAGSPFRQGRRPNPADPRPSFTTPKQARAQATLVINAPIIQPYSTITVSLSGKDVKVASPTISFGRGVDIRNAGLKVRQLPANLAALAGSGRAWTAHGVNGTPLRLLAAPDPGRGYLVVVTSLDGVDKTIGQTELILAIGSAAAGLLAAGGVAWVMRRGLRPIETMASQADAISAGDLTSRVSPHDPQTEVGRLGVALNGMLSRIADFIAEREASQEATRRFFADASHELRSPLASLRANAELYQQGALAERAQVDEAMRRITLEAKRMSGLVDDMLRLARLDQHPGREQELADLSAVLQGCAERARIADPERIWRVTIDPGLVVTGDEELLRRAAVNLLSNVSTHTPAGTVATILAEESDGVITVQVSDDGPGVPAGQLPRIFDRFYRGPAPSSRPGSGLGLAIVAAVAATHGGTAEAGLNDPHGLWVTLTLPVASALPIELPADRSAGAPAHPPDAGTGTGSPAAAAAPASRPAR
jgi:two-component system, OmpR family, sensor kinase